MPGRIRAIVMSVVVFALAAVFVAPAGAVLPEGRVYEQVSPEFKAGYPVFGDVRFTAASLSGESVSFASIGTFGGSGQDLGVNRYVARRSGSGWTTSSIFPSAAGGQCWQGLEQMSAELTSFEFLVSPGTVSDECSSSPDQTIWVREPDGSLRQASPLLSVPEGENSESVVGASEDLSRFVLIHSDEPEHQIVPDETQLGQQLFEVSGSSAGLAALDNSGLQLTRYCNVLLGGPSTAFGAVSQPDAAEVFFSVPVLTREAELCLGQAGHPEQLFVRLDGERTLEVSKPLTEDCSQVPCPGAGVRAPAVFQGASADGSVVFFTTTAALVGEDEGEASDLYMARIGCPGGGQACAVAQKQVTSLTLVSRDVVAGDAAEVEPRVLAVSPDGSHVYFVARGVLSEANNSEGQAAVRGAENLYVYDSTTGAESTNFVTDLCSGPEASGSVRDGECPLLLNANPDVLNASSEVLNDDPLWLATAAGEENHEAQTTARGQVLVFASYGRLIGGGSEADTDTAKDIYRYDAATGVLQRVSLGEEGFDGNGNSSSFAATIAPMRFKGSVQEEHELGDRAVTEDGSKIVFMTREPLSSSAVNGQQDVYLWSEGKVHLISSGTATEPDEEPIISPSGRDLFFLTQAGLTPGDSDGLRDVYDARMNGGFPAPAAGEEACSADACQGPLSAPIPFVLGGSETQVPGGNIASPIAPAPATRVIKPVRKPRRESKARKTKARVKSKAPRGGKGRVRRRDTRKAASAAAKRRMGR